MRHLDSFLVAAFYMLLTLAVILAMMLGSREVPDRYNPFAPLDLAEEDVWFVDLKMARAVRSLAACEAALLSGGVDFEVMGDLVDAGNAACGIEGRVKLRAIGDVDVADFETRCDMALRLSVWVEWDLRDLVREELGAELAGIEHFGSYSCRAMRGSSRMSKHATGRAIDVAGVRLDDGRGVPLLGNWDEGVFWKEAQRAACKRFRLVLGPGFNALHADHFHLQEGGGWGCR